MTPGELVLLVLLLGAIFVASAQASALARLRAVNRASRAMLHEARTKILAHTTVTTCEGCGRTVVAYDPASEPARDDA